jgi:hypothetical protein
MASTDAMLDRHPQVRAVADALARVEPQVEFHREEAEIQFVVAILDATGGPPLDVIQRHGASCDEEAFVDVEMRDLVRAFLMGTTDDGKSLDVRRVVPLADDAVMFVVWEHGGIVPRLRR